MDLNKAQVIGRLTQDPEVRATNSGTSVANFSVATNFVWTDSSGEKKEQVEYHDVVAWRKLADIIGQYLRKGARVYIDGRLQTRSWEGQDGVKRYRTEIIAENMIMLDSKGSGGGSGGERYEQAEQKTPKPQQQSEQTKDEGSSSGASAEEEEEISVEDIPF